MIKVYLLVAETPGWRLYNLRLIYNLSNVKWFYKLIIILISAVGMMQ